MVFSKVVRCNQPRLAEWSRFFCWNCHLRILVWIRVGVVGELNPYDLPEITSGYLGLWCGLGPETELRRLNWINHRLIGQLFDTSRDTSICPPISHANFSW